jgi:peptidase E
MGGFYAKTLLSCVKRYTILAFLSFKETFNSGASFYGASAGTEISTKLVPFHLLYK